MLKGIKEIKILETFLGEEERKKLKRRSIEIFYMDGTKIKSYGRDKDGEEAPGETAGEVFGIDYDLGVKKKKNCWVPLLGEGAILLHRKDQKEIERIVIREAFLGHDEEKELERRSIELFWTDGTKIESYERVTQEKTSFSCRI